LGRGRWRLGFLYNGYGSDPDHPVLRDDMRCPGAVGKMVTGPLELGLGKRDDLIAVTEFHEILVRAAAEA